MPTKSLKLVMQIALFTVSFALIASAAGAVGPDGIKWNKPVSMVERITGKEPVEVIPPEYDDYGVKISGKKGMLTGYKLPEGWREATRGVNKLVLLNSGSLPHDPATVLNAKIFEKMTGIHLEFVEMKSALIWPKYLSGVMAKSTDFDISTCDYPIVQMPHLSAAGWVFPVDELYPPEVQALYPKNLLVSLKGIDGRFYGSPLSLWARFFFYRPSWLAKAGVTVPLTWQDLIIASKKVDTWAKANLGPGYAGMVYAAATSDDLNQLWGMTTFSQGKRIIKNGKVVIDPQAWQVICDLWLKGGMSKGSVEYGWADAPEVFAKGKAGFIITGGVYMKMFADPKFGTGIQGDWDVTLTPGWKGIGNRGIAVAGNDSWVINPYISSAKKAAAMLWLDYQRSYQAQFNELYLEGNESYMPSVYNHPAVKKEVEYFDSRKATVAAQVGELYPPGMMDIIDIFKEYLQRVVVKGMNPEAARKEAQEQIDLAM